MAGQEKARAAGGQQGGADAQAADSDEQRRVMMQRLALRRRKQQRRADEDPAGERADERDPAEQTLGGDDGQEAPAKADEAAPMPKPEDAVAAKKDQAGSGKKDDGASAKKDDAGSQKGSAAILASSGRNELTTIGAFTPELAKRLDETNTPIDAVLTEMADSATRRGERILAHPTLARLGQDVGARFGTGPNRSGHFVANYRYENGGAVPTVVPESLALEGAMQGRGFETNRRDNLDGDGMVEMFETPVDNARPGDELLLSYVGHGTEEGLVGVQNQEGKPDLLRHNRIAGMLSKATDKGAHVRFAITACMSGNAAEKLRREQRDELRASPKANQHWLELSSTLEQLRGGLEQADREGMAQAARAEQICTETRSRAQAEQDPNARASIQAELEQMDAAVDQAMEQRRQQVVALWAQIRTQVMAIATEVAVADGRPAPEVPEQLDLAEQGRGEFGRRFLFGAVNDLCDDLRTRALDLAAGPKKL
jgi:hypothetical protein